jgi:hypothetical protein
VTLSRSTKGVVAGCFTRHGPFAFGQGCDHASYVNFRLAVLEFPVKKGARAMNLFTFTDRSRCIFARIFMRAENRSFGL